jgi:hypothetical protein
MKRSLNRYSGCRSQRRRRRAGRDHSVDLEREPPGCQLWRWLRLYRELSMMSFLLGIRSRSGGIGGSRGAFGQSLWWIFPGGHHARVVAVRSPLGRRNTSSARPAAEARDCCGRIACGKQAVKAGSPPCAPQVPWWVAVHGRALAAARRQSLSSGGLKIRGGRLRPRDRPPSALFNAARWPVRRLSPSGSPGRTGAHRDARAIGLLRSRKSGNR